MTVYLGTIVLILVAGLLYSNYEARCLRSYRGHYIIAVSILLILQSGLRNVAVGADTYAYLLWFEKIKSYNWADVWNVVSDYYLHGIGKDPGYAVFQKLAQYFLPDYQLFLILIAVIFFSALGNFIYRNTFRLSDAVLAYVLYCCLFLSFFSITGHRQTLATAAALCSYEFIKKRKLIPFLFLILSASTIHRSVLVFIPFYFVAKLKKVHRYYWSVLIILPLLMIHKTKFFEFITKWSKYGYVFHEGGRAYTFTFTLLLFAIVALWRMKVVIKQNKAARPIYMAFIFALIFTPLIWINPSAMRSVQYYSIFMLALAPAVVNSFEVGSPKIRSIAYTATLCLLIGLFVGANINSEYKFFWQEMALGANYK